MRLERSQVLELRKGVEALHEASALLAQDHPHVALTLPWVRGCESEDDTAGSEKSCAEQCLEDDRVGGQVVPQEAGDLVERPPGGCQPCPNGQDQIDGSVRCGFGKSRKLAARLGQPVWIGESYPSSLSMISTIASCRRRCSIAPSASSPMSTTTTSVRQAHVEQSTPTTRVPRKTNDERHPPGVGVIPSWVPVRMLGGSISGYGLRAVIV